MEQGMVMDLTSADFDVVIIGSGAGGGAVAWRLTQAGKRVLVLEKGPWFTEKDYFKDELACCRRSVYTPDLREEQHVIEERAGISGTATWWAAPAISCPASSIA